MQYARCCYSTRPSEATTPLVAALHPYHAAANTSVRPTHSEMRQTVAEFPPESLNWKPAGEDTNSVAVLATHSLHSTHFFFTAAPAAPIYTLSLHDALPI